MLTNTSDWCFAWAPRAEASPEERGKDRAALLRAYQWRSGDIVTLSFLDGDGSLRARVIEVAMRWIGAGMANLFLDFRSNTSQTLIRISFQYPGHWSMIGTSCRSARAGQATMNLGGLADATEERLRAVILHEFGHALGFVHEHQNPAGGILWNHASVYRDLSGPPALWSKQTIDANMFQPYAAMESNFTQTDPTSIMMYPVPIHWTINGFWAGYNSDLSPADRFLARTIYP